MKLPKLPAVKLQMPIDSEYREKLMASATAAARRVSDKMPRRDSLKGALKKVSSIESGMGIRKYIQENR